MEPQSRQEPLEDPRFLHQVKWDGVRYLAFLEGGRLKLQNRRLRVKTHLYPDLAPLAGALGKAGGVLDGEIIALGPAGTPSFPQVLRRDLVKTVTARLERQVPAVYMAFDLLYLGEQDLTARPLKERLKLLEEHLQDLPNLEFTRAYEDGLQLFQVMRERGMEGVVAKKKDSPYRAGQKTADWLKIKVSRFQDCLLGGYALKRGRVSTLLVGAFRDEAFLYLGRVSSGLKEGELQSLHRELYPFRRSTPPFANPPVLERSLEGVWLEPTLGLKVQYAEWTPDLKLRSPRVKGFIPFREGDWTLK
jgi:bifunctional non-homologous end joining protein LigD